MKYLAPALFVHINKTGGTSIEAALGLPAQHRTARQLREYVGETVWNDKLTFTVVRNPWDKVASQYYYRVGINKTGLGDRHLSLSEWVKKAYEERDPSYCDEELMFAPQLDWIADDDDHLLVDKVLRFESLEQEFANVCSQLGLNATLQHLLRSGNTDYRNDYDRHAAEIVRRRFARDIACFGYSFDDVA